MSASLNKVILIGHLGADAEVRCTAGGAPVASFSLATSERRKQADGSAREQVEWHRVTLYGRLAENARDHLRKGAQVYVEGRIRTDTWRDREGRERKSVVIVASQMQMLGKPEGRRERPDQAPGDMSWLDEAAPDDSGWNADSDDIPF